MEDFLTQVNTWGKGSFFKYGFLETLFFMVVFLTISFVLKRVLSRYIRHKVQVNTQVILRLVNIVITIIAGYACLSLLEPFDTVLSKIWGSAGIVAVVVGLAAQEAMGNFVNGILIGTFKPFKIGDLIKVNNGEYEGYVVDISTRDTVIQTYENTKIMIPNSIMNKAVLENVSSAHNIKGNFLELSISYDSDIDLAIQIITQEAMKHPNYLDIRSAEERSLQHPPIVVRLTAFNDSSMTLRTTIYSKNNAEGYAMLCDLRVAIKKRFDQQGIIFPHPHRDVTIHDHRTPKDN